MSEQTTATTPVKRSLRARVCGKLIFLGKDEFYVRGVTYGTFRPGADGNHYPEPGAVERDFARMAANGLNAVRTYTVPPRWLLDAARRHGLYVMVGLPWEQHITFLDDRRRVRSIEDGLRAGVRACAGHPAVLCYVIGSEIPASVVRWYGPRRVERYLERLYHAAKGEDPGSLVTYVNYPSTEYLRLPFLDFVAFNVYLEEQEDLEAYLARLHNVAGDKPVVMAEIGLDSRTHGEEAQARALEWQVRATFAAGCAGAFVFSWTDEWHRGGYDVEDWDFGLTRGLCDGPVRVYSTQRAGSWHRKLPQESLWRKLLVAEGPSARSGEAPCTGALYRTDHAAVRFIEGGCYVPHSGSDTFSHTIL